MLRLLELGLVLHLAALKELVLVMQLAAIQVKRTNQVLISKEMHTHI